MPKGDTLGHLERLLVSHNMLGMVKRMPADRKFLIREVRGDHPDSSQCLVGRLKRWGLIVKDGRIVTTQTLYRTTVLHKALVEHLQKRELTGGDAVAQLV